MPLFDDTRAGLVIPDLHQRRQGHGVGVVEQALGVEILAQLVQTLHQSGPRQMHIGGIGKRAIEIVAQHQRQPLVDFNSARPGRQRGEVAVGPFGIDGVVEAGQPAADHVEGCDCQVQWRLASSGRGLAVRIGHGDDDADGRRGGFGCSRAIECTSTSTPSRRP